MGTVSGRVSECETDLKSSKEEFRGDIKEHGVLIEELQKKLEDLEKSNSSKLDCDIFDDEIQHLRDAISSIATGSGAATGVTSAMQSPSKAVGTPTAASSVPPNMFSSLQS